MENTTRIADLPENNNQTYFSMPPANSNVSSMGDSKTQYKPLNIHPNPYLDNLPSQAMDKWPTSNGGGGGGSGGGSYGGNGGNGAHLQRLPSKDIRVSNAEFVQDPQIQPNYVPTPPDHSQNYIPDNMMYDQEIIMKKTPKKSVRFAEGNRESDYLESLWSKYKIPLFLCLVFFVFQLPLFNRYMKEYVPLPYFYNENQLTTTGMLFKSILFGSVYYVFMEYVFEKSGEQP